jgi:hypothetical protein
MDVTSAKIGRSMKNFEKSMTCILFTCVLPEQE